MVKVNYGKSHEEKPKTEPQRLYIDIETGEIVLVYQPEGVHDLCRYFFSFDKLTHGCLSGKKEANLTPYSGTITLINKS